MTVSSNIKAWVLYDGDCGLCRSLEARFRGILLRRGFKTVPLQEPWVAERLSVPPGDLLQEMRVLMPDGETRGGADAVLWLARHVWWASPLRWIAATPGGMPLLRSIYRWIAERRNCRTGTCDIQPSRNWPSWVPLAFLPPVAAFATRDKLAWEMMWALAFAIYAGCKWLSWWKARTKLARVPRGRSVGYLLLWPGIATEDFFNTRIQPSIPTGREWMYAAAKTIFGASILWGGVRLIPEHLWLLQGWLGMLGIIFTLHFGTFHLLALGWRAAGVPVEPLMNWPLAARTIGEFWQRRWNRGFNDIARRYVFQPLQSKLGSTAAMLVAFLASGLVHEAVITVPARAGYGLPTSYFLLQGLGIWAQKSRAGLGSKHGWSGRVFTILIVAGPAFWLFPPPFVERIVMPFLTAIGAT